MPTGRMVFHFEPTDTGSRVIITSFHNSADEFAQVIEMGQEEGMREAMGQIDDVLADLASFAHGVGTKTDILSDTSGPHQPGHPRQRRGRLARPPRARAAAAVDARPGRLDDAGLRGRRPRSAARYRYEWEEIDGSDTLRLRPARCSRSIRHIGA